MPETPKALSNLLKKKKKSRTKPPGTRYKGEENLAKNMGEKPVNNVSAMK